MEPSLFSAINLVIDFLLIIALSYYVPRHAPKVFIFLVLLNVSQYFIHIPLAEIPGIRDYPERQNNVIQVLEVLRTTRENFERTTPGVGMALPSPVFSLPDIKGIFDPRGPVQAALELAKSGDEARLPPIQKDDEEKSFKQRWAESFMKDPHALWLFVRIFWFAAAMIIFAQRASLGAGVLAFQIIPIPFLSFALPYTYFWMQDVKWVRSIQNTLRDPENAQSYLSPEGLGITIMAFAGLLMLMICGTLMTLAKRTSPQSKLERRFMNPDRYLVRINGNLLPFRVRGHLLEVQGIELNCRDVAVFPGRPNVWRLNSSTILEFVEKT
jgi:hypothetical protein